MICYPSNEKRRERHLRTGASSKPEENLPLSLLISPLDAPALGFFASSLLRKSLSARHQFDGKDLFGCWRQNGRRFSSSCDICGKRGTALLMGRRGARQEAIHSYLFAAVLAERNCLKRSSFKEECLPCVYSSFEVPSFNCGQFTILVERCRGKTIEEQYQHSDLPLRSYKYDKPRDDPLHGVWERGFIIYGSHPKGSQHPSTLL